MGPLVPRPTIDDPPEPLGPGELVDNRDAGDHRAADLGVDVDAGHRLCQFGGRCQHHGITDRHHLAARYPDWLRRLGVHAHAEGKPARQDPPGIGLASGLQLRQRRRADPRASFDLLLQGPSCLRVRDPVRRRAGHGDQGYSGQDWHRGSGGARGCPGRDEQVPRSLGELGPQPVSQDWLFKPAPGGRCQPGRQDCVDKSRRGRGRSSRGDPGRDRDHRPVPQVDAVGPDAQPAQRLRGEQPADPAGSRRCQDEGA